MLIDEEVKIFIRNCSVAECENLILRHAVLFKKPNKIGFIVHPASTETKDNIAAYANIHCNEESRFSVYRKSKYEFSFEFLYLKANVVKQ